MNVIVLGVAVVLMSLTATAQAQVAKDPDRGATATQAGGNAPYGFISPSGKIACMYFGGAIEQRELRCDVRNATITMRRPANCDLDFGRAFAVGGTNVSGYAVCHGDTVFDPALPVLNYGHTWQRDGFTCTSERTGMSCFNAHRRGFNISRAEQRVF